MTASTQEQLSNTSLAGRKREESTWHDVANSGGLDTPCVVVHGSIVRRNIARLAEYCREHQIATRPHAKTHKSLKIGQMQLDAGAVGLTVAKPQEAATFDPLGTEILLAYPAISDSLLRAVREWPDRRRLLVTVDSQQAIDRLAAAVPTASPALRVLVDVDVGMHRTGVDSVAESVALAQAIDREPALELAGLFFYPGHIWAPPEEQATELSKVTQVLNNHLAAWKEQGLAASIVSGGSTPTAYQSHWIGPLTEIRAGTYVFNDMNTVHGGFCDLDDCAVRVLATVVSTAVRDQVVLDAGTKVLAADRCIPRPDSGFGYLPAHPEATVTALSEEHAQVHVARCSRRPQLGERVLVVPNHVCPVMNLTDSAWWMDSDADPIQLPIDARGKVR